MREGTIPVGGSGELLEIGVTPGCEPGAPPRTAMVDIAGDILTLTIIRGERAGGPLVVPVPLVSACVEFPPLEVAHPGAPGCGGDI